MKPFRKTFRKILLLSPPSRRRGLKLVCMVIGAPVGGSPPSRRRGLKHWKGMGQEQRWAVASLAEAWIETNWTGANGYAIKSPPSRRRGLKPTLDKTMLPLLPSPPSRRRGLKPIVNSPATRFSAVASLAEAWIETGLYLPSYLHCGWSPPSRRRGLKQNSPGTPPAAYLSPPSRRRGLKQTCPASPLAGRQSPPSRRRGLKQKR